MEIRVLGPFEMWAGGRRVDLGPPQQRAVLAVLLAGNGQLVTADGVIDRVWGETPPARARRTLHAHIARIRGVLREAAAAETGSAPVLSHRCGGYILDVAPEQVDLHRFRQLVAQAGAASCAPRTRAELLGRAMSLWRGRALTGLTGEWAARTAQGWHHEQIEAALAWVTAQIGIGEPAAVLAPLAELVWENPLVEPLAAAQMRALHAAGQTPAALAVFTGIRTQLIEELGADPGAELRAAHRAILRGQPPSRYPAVAAASRYPAVPACRTAPGLASRPARHRPFK